MGAVVLLSQCGGRATEPGSSPGTHADSGIPSSYAGGSTISERDSGTPDSGASIDSGASFDGGTELDSGSAFDSGTDFDAGKPPFPYCRDYRDCPQTCITCPLGGSACTNPNCISGQCVSGEALCASVDCQNKACGATCEICPDGGDAGCTQGSCDFTGVCLPGPAFCEPCPCK